MFDRTAIIFIDIAKAYDSVDRTGILMNLRMLATEMDEIVSTWNNNHDV